MKYFLDTEFIEDGKSIDLISIGIVCEDGREYYAINKNCDFSKANEWVKENVLKKLPKMSVNPQTASPSEIEGMGLWKERAAITKDVAEFFGCLETVVPIDPQGIDKLLLRFHAMCPIWAIRLLQFVGIFSMSTKTKTGYLTVKGEPEIWAYYADYDWVVFCQLFGTMMDLPEGFPMYCRDIKQECDRLGSPSLPSQGDGEHDALADARWNRDAHAFLLKAATRS